MVSSFGNLGFAFKAVSSNGDIIGIILNGLMYRGDGNKESEENEESEENVEDVKFNYITTFLDKVERDVDVFNRYPNVDGLMDIKIISVDESYRGQGICKALINKTMWVKILLKILVF